MLAKNAESSLAGLGCRLIRQPINSETEFAKASQGPADEFIVRELSKMAAQKWKEQYETEPNISTQHQRKSREESIQNAGILPTSKYKETNPIKW